LELVYCQDLSLLQGPNPTRARRTSRTLRRQFDSRLNQVMCAKAFAQLLSEPGGTRMSRLKSIKTSTSRPGLGSPQSGTLIPLGFCLRLWP